MYQGRNKEKRSDNGFIYPMTDVIIRLVEMVNIVNVFKFLAVWGTRRLNSKKQHTVVERLVRRNRNYAVDVFIIFKFLFVIFLWWLEIDNLLTTIFVLYLLFMNSFTYFYYHVWEESAILNQFLMVHRVRRRFITLTTSIFYMILTYGYLYAIPYKEHFSWGSEYPTYLKSMLFSVSNSFNGGYNGVSPASELGELIKASEIILIFVFIAIVLARSVPQGNSK